MRDFSRRLSPGVHRSVATLIQAEGKTVTGPELVGNEQATTNTSRSRAFRIRAELAPNTDLLETIKGFNECRLLPVRRLNPS